jgi:hypothetical protein
MNTSEEFENSLNTGFLDLDYLNDEDIDVSCGCGDSCGCLALNEDYYDGQMNDEGETLSVSSDKICHSDGGENHVCSCNH